MAFGCGSFAPSFVLQKKKYDRVKTLDDDEEDDDEKDLIADEIFHGDAEGELEEGEAVDEPLRHGDDDEEGDEEESGNLKESRCEEPRVNREMSACETMDL